MKCNVGGIDRVLRVAVGLLLIALAASSVIGIWGWFGIVPAVTGLFRFCPLYPVLGINSCSAGSGCGGSGCCK